MMYLLGTSLRSLHFDRLYYTKCLNKNISETITAGQDFSIAMK